jgi:hypothetical protein
LIGVGLAVERDYAINRIGGKGRRVVYTRKKDNQSHNHNKRSAHQSLPPEQQILGLRGADHPLAI